MTAKQLIEVLRELDERISDDPFVSFVRTVAGAGEQLRAVTIKFAGTRAQAAGEAHAELRQILSTLRVDVRIYPVLELARDLETFKGTIRAFRLAFGHEDDDGELFSRVQEVANSYDGAIRSEAANSLLAELAFACARLRDELRVEVDAARRTIRELDRASDDDEDVENVLLIQVSGELDASELGNLLGSLSRFYEAAGSVLGVFEIDPLRVHRIETGTTWVEVFGRTDVLAVTAGLFVTAVSQLWRRFGPGGDERLRVELGVERVDALGKMHEVLREKGLDTPGVNDVLTTIVTREMEAIGGVAKQARRRSARAGEGVAPLIVRDARRVAGPNALPSPDSQKRLPPPPDDDDPT